MGSRLKEIVERAERWPQDKQDAAADMLLEMEEQFRTRPSISAEQAAEVARRLADAEPRYLTLEEVRARLAEPPQ